MLKHCKEILTNQFHITGKIIYINPNSKSDGQGVTIAHYPDNISDNFFEVGLVFIPEHWKSLDIKMYDYIDVVGHYVSIDKSLSKKAKLIHVVDNLLDKVSE